MQIGSPTFDVSRGGVPVSPFPEGYVIRGEDEAAPVSPTMSRQTSLRTVTAPPTSSLLSSQPTRPPAAATARVEEIPTAPDQTSAPTEEIVPVHVDPTIGTEDGEPNQPEAPDREQAGAQDVHSEGEEEESSDEAATADTEEMATTARQQTEIPNLPLHEELQRKFPQFAKDYFLCYGLSQGLPKELHGPVAEALLTLSRATKSESTLLTHMLLIEYLRTVRKKEEHTFMRGNSLPPTVIDKFTTATLRRIFEPMVDRLVAKIEEIPGPVVDPENFDQDEPSPASSSPKDSAETETTETLLRDAFTQLTTIPMSPALPRAVSTSAMSEGGVSSSGVQASTELSGSTRPEKRPKSPPATVASAGPSSSNEPDLEKQGREDSAAGVWSPLQHQDTLAPVSDVPSWCSALGIFCQDVVKLVTRVIDEASKDPDCAPLFTSVAELIRVATILDRKWATPESRFMDSSVLAAYPASTNATPSSSARSLRSGAMSGRSLGETPSTLPANASFPNASFGNTSVVNEDLVDSMLATLIMLRVVGPMLATKGVSLLRGATTDEERAAASVTQKRVMAIAKLLQKAANRRTFDAPHEQHLSSCNEFMPLLTAALQESLRHMAKPVLESCAEATLRATPKPQETSIRIERQPSETDYAELANAWQLFIGIIRSYWLPITHHMGEIQPLLHKEHISKIDKMCSLFNQLADSIHRTEQHVDEEIADVEAEMKSGGKNSKKKAKKWTFSFNPLANHTSEDSDAPANLAHRKENANKMKMFCALAHHGYRRLQRKFRGTPYYIATPSGINKNGCSVVMIFGDQIALAHNAYQARQTVSKAAAQKVWPSYPHGKYNDFHIVADIACAIHAATMPMDEKVTELLKSLEIPIEFGGNGGISQDETRWLRKCVVVFVPNTDPNMSTSLGPTWLHWVFDEIFPAQVVGNCDKVVVTQQSSRISRYTVMLKGALGGGGSSGKKANGQEAEGEDIENAKVKFCFGSTFGEALTLAGLDACAVALPVHLPLSELKNLLRYQELVAWRQRAHRGLYAVLPMLADAVTLLHYSGNSASLLDSFIAIGAEDSLEAFTAKPLVRSLRRRPTLSPVPGGAAKPDVRPRSGTYAPGGSSPGLPTPQAPKNLAHLTLLSPNNTPAALEENQNLFGLRFCHTLCLALDAYRNEDITAHTSPERKALPCLSVPHLISELKRKKNNALGINPRKDDDRRDCDITHELMQLFVFITLQQHHVSGASEWRERLTQAAWELFRLYYTPEDRELLRELAIIAHPSHPGKKKSKLHTDSEGDDLGMWVEISTSYEAPLDSTVVKSSPSESFTSPTTKDDSLSLKGELTTAVCEIETKHLLDEGKYLRGVREFFARNYDVWGTWRKDRQRETILPEDSMLSIIRGRRHVLLYDRHIVETAILLAHEALEKSVPSSSAGSMSPSSQSPTAQSPAPDMGSFGSRAGSFAGPGFVSPASFVGRPPAATASGAQQGTQEPPHPLANINWNSVETLRIKEVQCVIRSLQKLLFLKSIDWWKASQHAPKAARSGDDKEKADEEKKAEDEEEDPDWETATFVLTWTLLRHHKYVLGADHINSGPMYEALLTGWR